MSKTQRAIENRLRALDVINSQKLNNLSFITPEFGVSANFLTILKRDNYIKHENGCYVWAYPQSPSLIIAKQILYKERDYLKNRKHPVAESFTALDTVIKWTEIGFRYGVSDIKGFVKEMVK